MIQEITEVSATAWIDWGLITTRWLVFVLLLLNLYRVADRIRRLATTRKRGLLRVAKWPGLGAELILLATLVSYYAAFLFFIGGSRPPMLWNVALVNFLWAAYLSLFLINPRDRRRRATD